MQPVCGYLMRNFRFLLGRAWWGCQYLGPRFRDDYSVFELGRSFQVRRYRRPGIGPDSVVVAPHRDHRLDREHHVRLHQRVRTRLEIVRDVQTGVEALADAVAPEDPHDPVTLRFDKAGDRLADVADRMVGLDRANPQPHRLT